jgi:uncharacterized protein YoxC
MAPWLQVVAAVCAVALTAALVAVLISLRRTLVQLGAVLAVVERELRPLVTQVEGLVEELKGIGHKANREIDRVGVVTRRAEQIADSLGRIAAVVGEATRFGQAVGLILGLRKGLAVFAKRMRAG